jgi:hypothetical protein
MQANQRQLLKSALAFSQSIVNADFGASASLRPSFAGARSRRPPALAIISRRSRVDGCATSGMDHICDRQCFEGRMQASEIVEIIEYSFCDLVSHGVRHARRGDDHGADTKGANIRRITRVRAAGYHRALVFSVFGQHCVDARAAHVDQRAPACAGHVLNQTIRMGDRIDDRVELIRTKGTVLFRGLKVRALPRNRSASGREQ